MLKASDCARVVIGNNAQQTGGRRINCKNGRYTHRSGETRGSGLLNSKLIMCYCFRKNRF